MGFSVVNEGFTYTNLSFFHSSFFFLLLLLFTIGVCGSWCLPLHWCGSTEFIFQSVYVFLFFSCCSVFRATTLYPSPWLLFALLICSLCCARSVSSLLCLPHSSVCVCIVWVCTNGREFLRLLPIGWQRPMRIGCTQCIVREKGREEGGQNSSRLGSGESGDRVRGCFCFEMAGFESRRGTSQLVCQWHTELIGPDTRAVSPLAKVAAILLFFSSCSAVCSCASLLSSPATLAALAPKCSPPHALRAWASFRVEALPELLVLLPPAGNCPKQY